MSQATAIYRSDVVSADAEVGGWPIATGNYLSKFAVLMLSNARASAAL
ncbi:hypothetical protein SAMN05444920_1448 [Nonomuraea solani]|uniref:Uncharacterized protein n=1 Tax=Nonomuraea solani TaxID=1144553 RepID=A0A1H6F3H5_9ACTN|nr:hypothetical protein SAMN05444920_1448 [Nonomuraea solani]